MGGRETDRTRELFIRKDWECIKREKGSKERTGEKKRKDWGIGVKNVKKTTEKAATQRQGAEGGIGEKNLRK